MNGLAVLLSVAVIGVDYGWQPSPDGHLEYIIQIEPGLVETMKAGSEIVSEIHPDARGVRRFRIRIGTGPLPRRGGVAPATPGQGIAPPGAPSVLPPNTNNPAGPATVPHLSDSRGSSSWPTRGESTQPNISAPPLLNLPPPPWTLGEQAQMRSVLVGGQPASPRPTNNAAPATGVRSTEPPAGTGQHTDVLPPNIPGQTNATDTRPGNSWGPSATHASDTGSPYSLQGPAVGTGQPRIGATILGPTGQPANTAPTTNTSPPNKAISPPQFNLGPQPPIRDPDARAKNNAPRSKANIASQHGHPNRLPSLMEIVQQKTPDKDARRSLVSRLSEADNPKSVAATKPELDEKTAERLAELQTAKPWLPLLMTSMLLFASLAANAYLGWIAVGVYRRYRDVVKQLRRATRGVV